MSEAAAKPTSVSLRADHHRLDQLFTDLCECARIGTWHEVEEMWPRFAGELDAHMRYEEQHLFGAFAETPDGLDRIAELRAEHAALRQLVDATALDVELHVLRAETIDRLVAALRAHAAREERVFYPWLARKELARADAG